jgi:hypothetical protein
MTSTTTPAGGAHGRATTRLLEAVGPPGVAVCLPASEWAAVGPPASTSDIWSLPTMAHRGVYRIIHLLLRVFYFSRSLNVDTLPYINISTSKPPMDEVIVACPLARTNSNTYGRAIYIGSIANLGGDATHISSSSSSKLMV